MDSRAQVTKPKFQLYVVQYLMTTAETIRKTRDALNQVLGEHAFELEIIDVASDPEAAYRGRIMATPTLVRSFPPPEVRIIGHCCDRDGITHLFKEVDTDDVP